MNTDETRDGCYIIHRCVFRSNSAVKVGGAVAVMKSNQVTTKLKVCVRDLIFVNNVAKKSGQALFIENHAKRIKNITIMSSSDEDGEHLHAVGRWMDISEVSYHFWV